LLATVIGIIGIGLLGLNLPAVRPTAVTIMIGSAVAGLGLITVPPTAGMAMGSTVVGLDLIVPLRAGTIMIGSAAVMVPLGNMGKKPGNTTKR